LSVSCGAEWDPSIDDDDATGDDDDATDDDDSVPNDGDGDGFASETAGGEDCDDADPLIYPGATENPANGVDDDCDDTTDEGIEVSSVSPDNGLAGGGAIVVLNGSGLTGVLSVTLGGLAATDVDDEDDNTVEFFIPLDATRSAGPVDIVVGNTYGSVTLPGAFLFSGANSSLDSATLTSTGLQTITIGNSTSSYSATVTEDGVTSAVGQGAGILAEIGLGGQGFLPTDVPDSWAWFPALYSGDSGASDVYSGTLTPGSVGGFWVTFRFSNDGGLNWYYADSDPSDGHPDFLQLATLDVTP